MSRNPLPVNKSRGEPTGPMYQTWAKGDAVAKERALNRAGSCAATFDPILRTSAYNTFENIAPNLSVRDSYSRRDYSWFRGEERIPRRQKDIIRECMEAYRRIGIIHNVIDLMADFTHQGITPCHTIPATDRFVKAWWKKVRGTERSERFVNLLLRAGNVIIHRRTAKLTNTRMEKLTKTGASPDLINPETPENIRLSSMEIPWQYTFLNPLDVDVVGEEIAAFTGVAQYTLKVPNDIISSINADNLTSAFLSRMPPSIIKMIKSGAKYIPLPVDKTVVYHYKKDDWQAWADPIHFCILEDLIDYQKARLADRTALDAASSRIRIWRLGSLEHELIPNQAAFIRLNNMLMALGSGGTIDIMWTPDLEVEEISSDMNKYFGPEKYQQTLSNIYAGLGIPSTLTGEGGKSFTNNFVSLKTLVERLEYARMILTEFWTDELNALQKSIGAAQPFILTYDRISMTDDAAEKALLVQLSDRDLISHESIMDRFDLTPELENSKIKREHKKREAGKLPERASPYHKTGNEQDMKKLALQRGLITPEDVGVPSSLDTKKILMQQAMPKPAPGSGAKGRPVTKRKGTPQQGRPKNSKDSSRKQKRVTPKTKAALANMITWAKDTQRMLGDMLTPVYLQTVGKKNLRQLSNEESNDFERFKFAVLANIEPLTKVSQESVETLLESPLEIDAEIAKVYADTVIEFMSKANPNPTVEDIRNIAAVSVIAGLINNENEEEDNG